MYLLHYNIGLFSFSPFTFWGPQRRQPPSPDYVLRNICWQKCPLFFALQKYGNPTPMGKLITMDKAALSQIQHLYTTDKIIFKFCHKSNTIFKKCEKCFQNSYTWSMFSNNGRHLIQCDTGFVLHPTEGV